MRKGQGLPPAVPAAGGLTADTGPGVCYADVVKSD